MDWMDELRKVYTEQPGLVGDVDETAELDVVDVEEPRGKKLNSTVVAVVAGLTLLGIGGAAWTVVTSGLGSTDTQAVAETTAAAPCSPDRDVPASASVVVDFQTAYWAGDRPRLTRTLAKDSPMRNEHWDAVLPKEPIPACVEIVSSSPSSVTAKTTVEQPDTTVVYKQEFVLDSSSGDPLIVTIADTDGEED